MEKVKKDKMFTSVSIGAATVWFSTHCGAGFASGTQELQYFSNHGWWGPLFPFLTILIIAITYYVGLERQDKQINGIIMHGQKKLQNRLGPLVAYCLIFL
jgi:uncharacterized membrane protein YkvI